MSFHNRIPHHLNPIFTENFLIDNEKKLYIEPPHPIHQPFETGTDFIRNYIDKCKKLKLQAEHAQQEFNHVNLCHISQDYDGGYATVTNEILQFCKDFEKPPIICDYNPYYAMGIMEYFELNGKEFLVRPYRAGLRVTNLSKPRKKHKLNINTCLNDITGIASTHEQDHFFLLQHTKEVNLVRLSSSKSGELLWNKKFDRQLLCSRYNSSKIGVIQSNLKPYLYDVESDTKLKFPGKYSDVFFLDFLNDNEVALLSQKRLTIVDWRSDDSRTFDAPLENCDFLCSLKIDEKSIFLGSRHYLIKSDTRFKKTMKSCAHMLKSSPCFMELLRTTDDRYIVLSSQNTEDKVLFYGEKRNSLPLFVPSVKDTLEKCYLKKDILLKPTLQMRLKNSTGGVKLVPKSDDNHVALYSCNSFGEIFKQTIGEFQRQDIEAINALHQWIKELPETEKKLHLTDAVNLSDARFVLNKKIDLQKLSRCSKSDSQNKQKFLSKFGPLYDDDQLGDLARNFSSVWVDAEEVDREPVSLMPEVEPVDKVSKWIESSSFF